jgi:uncharacterized OsmC-like protein
MGLDVDLTQESIDEKIKNVKEGTTTEITIDGYVSKDRLREILQMANLTSLDISRSRQMMR